MLTKRKKIIISLIIIAIIASFIVYVYSTSNKVVNPYPMDQNYFLRRGAVNLTLNTIENEVENEVVEEAPIQEVEKVVEYKGKKIEIPKAVVATTPVEDNERAQKTGGEKVNVASYEAVGGEWKGIDVSYWQGNIDWKAVANSGIDFAILRVGYRGYSSGKMFEDSTFARNANGAVANGIKIGVYFYSTAINEEEALQEAAWVCNRIAGYGITYPVVYDFEDFGKYRCAGLSGSDVTKNALAFLNYVSSRGYSPMMYANPSDMSKYLSRSSFPMRFWLAHYVKGAPEKKSSYTGSYQMWQYTSQGTVPGIRGGVDMNIAYFGYAKAERPKHTHDYSTFVSSKKEATCTEKGISIYRCSCGEVSEVEVDIKHNITTRTEGNYEITYCKDCNVEISRKNISTNANSTNQSNTSVTNTTGNSNTSTNTNTNTNTNSNTNTPTVSNTTQNSNVKNETKSEEAINENQT